MRRRPVPPSMRVAFAILLVLVPLPTAAAVEGVDPLTLKHEDGCKEHTTYEWWDIPPNGSGFRHSTQSWCGTSDTVAAELPTPAGPAGVEVVSGEWTSNSSYSEDEIQPHESGWEIDWDSGSATEHFEGEVVRAWAGNESVTLTHGCSSDGQTTQEGGEFTHGAPTETWYSGQSEWDGCGLAADGAGVHAATFDGCASQFTQEGSNTWSPTGPNGSESSYESSSFCGKKVELAAGGVRVAARTGEACGSHEEDANSEGMYSATGAGECIEGTWVRAGDATLIAGDRETSTFSCDNSGCEGETEEESGIVLLMGDDKFVVPVSV